MPIRLIQLIWITSIAAVFLLPACAENSTIRAGSSNRETIAPGMMPKEASPAVPLDPQPREPDKQEAEIPENSFPIPAEEPVPSPVEDPAPMETSEEEIDWGKEVDLPEIIAKARRGEIREIQWHVMPNVLRAQTFDDRIFHLKNENRGVDLRNRLISAGVQIGKGGVAFRHVF